MPRIIPALTPALALAASMALTTFGVMPAPASAAPAPAEEASGQLLVILDVSGSMERKDASGATLMQGAREAVRTFVGSVPGETEIGLRLYGSEYAGDAKAPGCRDTRLAVPIAPAADSGGKIVAAVDQAKPTGFTPIGYSLTQAADDFSVEGERSIVLVSDGEDTCGNPAPCKAAKQLARDGIEVRVDTVGLFLQDNPAAAKQLECIAAATGGTYVPADDTAALTEQLSAVSSRAISRFKAAGEEIVGGPSRTDATAIEPGVTYVDDVLNGEARWYSVEVPEGQQVTITSTDDGSAPYGCCIYYELYDPKGSRLAADHGYNAHGSANTHVVVGEPRFRGFEGEYGTHLFGVLLNDTTAEEQYGALPFEFTAELTAVPSTQTTSPTETASATPTETPSATPSETPDDTTAGDSESDSDGAALPTFVWVLIGLLVLAVLGLGALVLTLFRKMGAARP